MFGATSDMLTGIQEFNYWRFAHSETSCGEATKEVGIRYDRSRRL